jgi:diaminohydroxyphosphoribosylaminopyrimidine deaminase/5-amino-6-(5-phosphoribosylamino)uracil reductase
VYRDHKAPTWIAAFGKPQPAAQRKWGKSGVQILRVPLKFSRNGIRYLLRELAKKSVSQLLIEGGGETAWRFLDAKAVDELYFFIAPKLAGGRRAPTSVGGPGFRLMTQAVPVQNWSVTRLGDDLVVHGHLKAA